MFNNALNSSIIKAFAKAEWMRHTTVTVEHLLYGLLDNADVKAVFAKHFIPAQILREQLEKFFLESPTLGVGTNAYDGKQSPTFQRVLQRALFQVQYHNQAEVTGVHVMIAIYAEKESLAVRFLEKATCPKEIFVAAFQSPPPQIKQGGDTKKPTQATSEDSASRESLLLRFATNLNQQVLLGKVDSLIGRNGELERIVQTLCRRRKNNPLLVGEAGVGKTALAVGLAERIVSKKVPAVLHDTVIYSLDLGALVAGTKYRGDFEKRFKSITKELRAAKNVIIFIDEIHTLLGSGSASGTILDGANLLKPLLSSGEVRCIGSTTFQEYRQIFEKDSALDRRFQKVDIKEPSVEETIKILQGLKTNLEVFHGVTYTEDALRTVVELAVRYIHTRKLPDKAIDVMDEAGAFQRLQTEENRREVIDTAEIEEIVAKMANIPSHNISISDKDVLKNLESNMQLSIFGQDAAIKALATAIKLSRAGLQDVKKPISSLIFSGPTGVGKTEVTKQLAAALGIELLRFDMSEYMESHSISRLIGSPPGYIGSNEGGLLTEEITKNPHSILLLDEIEKAHPDIFNVLLQIMDHGSLTDNKGRVANFRHVIIIMTTNVGAELLERTQIGFVERDVAVDSTEAIKKLFSPEFRNRLDGVIQFNHLNTEVIMKVVRKSLMELELQLASKGVTLHLDEEVEMWLVENGYDRAMGARPMARCIQEEIKKPLAEELIFGRLSQGGSVRLYLEDNKISFAFSEVADSTEERSALNE